MSKASFRRTGQTKVDLGVVVVALKQRDCTGSDEAAGACTPPL